MEGSAACLADLCDLIAEPVKPGSRPDDLYLGLEHLSSSRLTRTGGGKASAMRSTTLAFRPGDVLYGKLRPYLDKAVLANEAGVCTTSMLVLRAKTNVDPRFLIALIHSPSFLEYAVTGTTGVTHPSTSWAHVREFEVPVFASDEQQLIGDLIWLAHETISRSEALIEKGQELKRAAMQTLFTRGFRGEVQKETEIGPIPKTWDTPKVVEVIRPFKFDRKKQIPRSAYPQTGRWPIIDQSQEFIASYANDKARVIHSDTPIIIFGDHTRILKFVDFDFILGGDGTKLFLASDEFDPKFLYYSLCNLDIPARGYNRHHRMLCEMRIGKPDLTEQREIVAILDAIDRKIDLHRRKRAVLDELFKTLLHKLMTGEIRVADLDLSAMTGTISETFLFAGKNASEQRNADIRHE